MLDTLLGKDTPPSIADDVETQRTEQAWRAAEREVHALQPEYARLRLAAHKPPTGWPEGITVSEEEEDTALALFPLASQEFHQAVTAMKEKRKAYDVARNKAYHLRHEWFVDRLRNKEGVLIDTIQGAVRSAVLSIHELVQEAQHEGISVQPTDFGAIPLFWGSPMQSGIENWNASQS